GRRLRLDQVNKRLADLARETEDIRVSLGEVESKTRDARGRLEAAVERMATLEEQRIELEERRARCVEQRGEARERADERRMAAHDLALQLESQRSTQVSASASLERMQSQLAHLDRRQQEIRQKIVDGEAPLKDEQAQLATKLDERVEVETALTEARTVADAVDARLREVDEARQRSEGDVQSAREQLDDIRMRAQETRIRRESCAEQFAETGLERDAVQNELPEEAAVGEWETRLEAMTTRIQRLGPINLAAIDEFEEESKRQEYLDSQYEDLTEALGTLENAIRKIDRETRTRFKETFDRVDAQMKSIFPRLFGGGHAHLELTGDDLLSAGVAVMARPPGKRISNIHLMSGGEKALTAVALVFSIFELNPAPFCMLDEVDAPLDDANVARFCDIVKEMSERVQFVIITHNKVTMELASHLAGVTMQEPGVSRLVAVDVDEAVQLAAV
ncbi:MAG: chromosome segregation protein SMC, partial [Pseudomonadota bacterium]